MGGDRRMLADVRDGQSENRGRPASSRRPGAIRVHYCPACREVGATDWEADARVYAEAGRRKVPENQVVFTGGWGHRKTKK
jgi:hypothetical protein